MEQNTYTPEELEKRFGPKRLREKILGQLIIPDREGKTFKYGNLETVYPMTFKFVYKFGGFSGRRLERPPEGRAWIRQSTSIQPLYWEVSVVDLEGKYEDAQV